jgi:peptidoglycan/LPS O-acetylase OafA/YrhL
VIPDPQPEHPSPLATSADDAEFGAIPRIPAIDGLRGVAIGMVLALHFGVAAEFRIRTGTVWGEWLERLFYTGWAGVDLFFVLSGFLITSILLASRSHPRYFRLFYARRALRILPLYYTGVVLVFVAAPLVAPGVLRTLDQGTEGQVWLWTYTLNIALVFGWANSMGLLGHFWTLAIEEQYYLFWPIVVKWTTRSTLIGVCGALALFALGLRAAWIALGYSWEGAYRFTLARFDALAIGALTAALMSAPQTRATVMAAGPFVLTSSAIAIGFLFLGVPRFYPSEPLVVTIGHTLLAVASAALITMAVRDRPPGWMQNRSLRLLGKYSYSIYVWHWPIQRALVTWYPHAIGGSPWAASGSALAFLAIGVALSSVAGWASYRLIEQPFLRLKPAFGYRTRSTSRTG